MSIDTLTSSDMFTGDVNEIPIVYRYINFI